MSAERFSSKEILKRVPQIGVIGGSMSTLPLEPVRRQRILDLSEDVGREIAKAGAILISGGMDGVMEASCKGAYEQNGITVGTPGRERNTTNPYVKIEVCTPIDTGDYLFAGLLSCDSIITFPGGAGTLAEIALGYRFVKPMIIMQGLDPWLDQLIGKTLDTSLGKLKFLGANSPIQAVTMALSNAKTK